MKKTKKDCLDEYNNYIHSDEHKIDDINFKDSFGWYCKKYYFDEPCTDDPNCDQAKYFLDSYFYDLMEIFEGHRDFIKFCLNLSEGFSEKEGEIDRTIPRIEDTENYKIICSTNYFLNVFLKLNGDWERVCNVLKINTFKDKWNYFVERIENIDWDCVRNHIKNEISYKNFLKTPYWKLISHKKKINSKFKCDRCDDKGVLNVHHKNYDILGLEYFSLKDLEVLCESCHRLEHGIDKIS